MFHAPGEKLQKKLFTHIKQNIIYHLYLLLLKKYNLSHALSLKNMLALV